MVFRNKRRNAGHALILLFLLAVAWAANLKVSAAVDTPTAYTFPETGKAVSGTFLAYWLAHGGVAIQGYPISNPLQEKSDTDGKVYTVQYFERDVLEQHLENQPPYDVLPSLLGVFMYHQKYPNGAPGQSPNASPGSIVFNETGKRLGGGFLAYWQSTGGLIQHGYPISDEFTEVSELDGKPYTVQYFQRAVFEFHPEKPDPYRVLLSQLGTFRYRQKYLTPPPTPTRPAPTPSPTPAFGHMYGSLSQSSLGENLDPAKLRAQYNSGVRVWLVQLGWNVLQTGSPSDWNDGIANEFQQRIDAFTALGPDAEIVLDLGIQYAPNWAAQIDPLVDQFGNRWDASGSGSGGVNVYWSPTVRQRVAGYIGRVFSKFNFHDRLWAVRVGVYGGELLYPQQDNGDHGLSFWAFDDQAQAKSPVAGWKPGQDSPNGEAQRFYNWYVDNLAGTFNFFLGEIRHYYQGYVAPVTPGMGMSPRAISQLAGNNLVDTSLQTYGTGNDWERLFSKLPGADQKVINWCSSMGDGSGNDGSSNMWDWSSARLQAALAHQNGRQIYGENSGDNPFDTSSGDDGRTTAQWVFKAMKDYDYTGVLWVDHSQMTDPSHTTLDQLKLLIQQYR